MSAATDNTELVDDSHLAVSPQITKSNLVEFPLLIPDQRDQRPHIEAIVSILKVTDPVNIEKAIKYCRLCLTSPYSHHQLTLVALGHLLHCVFELIGDIDHLQESITVNHDLIKMPLAGVLVNLLMITEWLMNCLLSWFKLFKDRRDMDKIVELFAVTVTDTSTEVPVRFCTLYEWSHTARFLGH